MGKQIVDKSGFLLLGTSADPDSLFDGTQVKQASLTLTSKIATAQAVGEAYADEAVVSKSYEISGTAYYPSDGAHSLFAVGDTCHATYYAQHAASGALDKVLFAGPVVVTKVADTQQQGEFETQEISVRSTGTPTTPPYTT